MTLSLPGWSCADWRKSAGLVRARRRWPKPAGPGRRAVAPSGRSTRRDAFHGAVATLVTIGEDTMTTGSKTIRTAVVATPIGELVLVTQAGALREIRLPGAAGGADGADKPPAGNEPP